MKCASNLSVRDTRTSSVACQKSSRNRSAKNPFDGNGNVSVERFGAVSCHLARGRLWPDRIRLESSMRCDVVRLIQCPSFEKAVAQ